MADTISKISGKTSRFTRPHPCKDQIPARPQSEENGELVVAKGASSGLRTGGFFVREHASHRYRRQQSPSFRVDEELAELGLASFLGKPREIVSP